MRPFTLLFLFFTAVRICFAQTPQPAPFLSAELEDAYCSEGLSAELDRFLGEVHSYPAAKGYIVFNGKRSQEGKNQFYFKVLKSHMTFRGVDPNRVILFRAEDADKMVMRLGIVPEGAVVPALESAFVAERIVATTRFDVAWADWHKWNDSEWTIHSHDFANFGCDADLNMQAFAETLHSQPDLTGYLVVYTKFGKGKRQAKKVTNFAIKELTVQYNVSIGRLKAVYGGTRIEPQLELWLVPQGGPLPFPNFAALNRNK